MKKLSTEDEKRLAELVNLQASLHNLTRKQRRELHRNCRKQALKEVEGANG